MTIPVKTLIANVTPQISELGSNPIRVFPGPIPQGTQLPAVTYTVTSGNPENYIDAPPTLDSIVVTVDVWEFTSDACDALADKVRRALEDGGKNCCIRLNPDDYEPDTRRFRVSFDFEFWLSR